MIALYLVISLCTSWVLSDSNIFLKSFVGIEMLNFLGVVITITLASIANLHLQLNKWEEKIKKKAFSKTRSALKNSAYSLLVCMFFAFILCMIKPLILSVYNSEMTASYINGAAVLTIIFSLIILLDILIAAFKLEPIYEN